VGSEDILFASASASSAVVTAVGGGAVNLVKWSFPALLSWYFTVTVRLVISLCSDLIFFAIHERAFLGLRHCTSIDIRNTMAGFLVPDLMVLIAVVVHQLLDSWWIVLG